MADIYSNIHRQQHYAINPHTQIIYHSSSSFNDNNNDPQSPPKSDPSPSPTDSKPLQKTQSTFLTKLYALLEKPENHHMIRWDPAGDHIIVERPEQLALHVLPSVYRQSRFASFSRQLNIYGFMRKVNLRNVDPAIDDPDASTWSHPTLNRHSPPEVVANFKRRVPPRLPKPRKRQEQEMPHNIPPPRSAIGMGPVPLTVPSSTSAMGSMGMGGGGMSGPSSPGSNSKGRARGFSAPGSFTPLTSAGAAGWATSYPRPHPHQLPPPHHGGHPHHQHHALPPLTVPSDPPPLAHSHTGSIYSQSAGGHLHPMSPTDDVGPQSASAATPNSNPFSQQTPYSNTMYSYQAGSSDSWAFSPVSSSTSSSGHSGSLSSLLNPSGNQYSRPPAINTYPSPFSSVPMNNSSQSSLSPDSRPTTGYSVSSMGSMQYDTENTSLAHDFSRPNSSHHHQGQHRPMSPSSLCAPDGRLSQPQSRGYSPNGISQGSASSSLTMRQGRGRRHTQAVSPYPLPYDHGHGSRPSTSESPQPGDGDVDLDVDNQGQIPRVRSMIQLPAVDTYGSSNNNNNGGSSHFSGHPAQAEFAYTPGPPHTPMEAHHQHQHQHQMDTHGGWHTNPHQHQQHQHQHHNVHDLGVRSVRPSTSASSLSTSSSQAHTPPMDASGQAGGYGSGGDDVGRFVSVSGSPDHFGFVPLSEGIPAYAKQELAV